MNNVYIFQGTATLYKIKFWSGTDGARVNIQQKCVKTLMQAHFANLEEVKPINMKEESVCNQTEQKKQNREFLI